jgi:cell division protein FtsI/penicillin-binding protein 2
VDGNELGSRLWEMTELWKNKSWLTKFWLVYAPESSFNSITLSTGLQHSLLKQKSVFPLKEDDLLFAG